MKAVAVKGIIPPILTPMNADESINFAELKNQVARMTEAGVHGIFANGTNGESYALTAEEKEAVLAAVVEQNAGRVPIYAGSGCVTTAQTVAASRRAQQLGADVLSVVTPYFAAASQEELYAHFMTVAEAVDLPIVLYNIPARTGNALAPQTVRRLAQNAPNIVGAKDSSGNFDNLLQYIEGTRDLGRTFDVLSGNDSLILPGLVFGGSGGIAGCANVFPKTMVAIYENFIAGDFEKAKAAQDSIRPFRNCFKYGNPNTIVKLATKLLGHEVGDCRQPFSTLSDEGRTKLAEVLQACAQSGMN